jgi:hypothetical protein
VDRAERVELEMRLIQSYESYVALKSVIRKSQGRPLGNLNEVLDRERQMQQYLHALLGHKGEPPGLLY